MISKKKIEKAKKIFYKLVIIIEKVGKRLEKILIIYIWIKYPTLEK